MAINIEKIPVEPGRGMRTTLNGRIYAAYPITTMKSGEGHSNPAQSVVSEVATMISDAQTKFASRVILFFVTDKPDQDREFENAIRVEERAGIEYAEVTFGLLAVREDKNMVTSTNDGTTWVPADSRPAGE